MKKHNSKPEKNTDYKVRLDKWLWAARFYKTRSLCKEAINGGKIQLSDTKEKAKANKTVLVGEQISVRQGWDTRVIIVDQVSERRGSATDAQHLYHETAESIAKRDHESQARKSASEAISFDKNKPSKKDRRQRAAFTQKNEGA